MRTSFFVLCCCGAGMPNCHRRTAPGPRRLNFRGKKPVESFFRDMNQRKPFGHTSRRLIHRPSVLSNTSAGTSGLFDPLSSPSPAPLPISVPLSTLASWRPPSPKHAGRVGGFVGSRSLGPSPDLLATCEGRGFCL